jgi:hypothetical protein
MGTGGSFPGAWRWPPTTSAEVKKICIYTSTPPYAFMAHSLISSAEGTTYLFVQFNVWFEDYFWNAMPCSIIQSYQRFSRNGCRSVLFIPEDGGSRLRRNFGTSYQIIRPHISDDHNLHTSLLENLTRHSVYNLYFEIFVVQTSAPLNVETSEVN